MMGFTLLVLKMTIHQLLQVACSSNFLNAMPVIVLGFVAAQLRLSELFESQLALSSSALFFVFLVMSNTSPILVAHILFRLSSGEFGT